jgi:hypothetical protein
MRSRYFLQGDRSDRRVVARILVFLLPLLLLAESTRAQDIYMYPTKGQDQAQQDRDRYECNAYNRAMAACLTGRGYTVN